jgi:ABC-type glycerol-3-phosphate transport system permease component
LHRLWRSIVITVGVVVGALAIGMVGYHGLEGLSWIDSFLNAAMILSGMGPATELHTASGKLFAGCYAIFSGVIFITMAAVLFAPMIHRFLHRFHLELEGKNKP